MKPLFAILLCAYSALATGFSRGGLDEIRFGMEREEVIEFILALGHNPMGQGRRDGRLWIPYYRIGDLPVEVSFLFNREGKFYSYEVRTGRVERDRFAKAIEAVRYMSETMQKEFGNPEKRFSPRIEEVRHGLRTFYWQWNLSDLDVATFLTSLDSRYYTVGVVTHRTLARDP